MISFSYVNYTAWPAHATVDLLWLSFKQYYTENGKNPDSIIWNDPHSYSDADNEFALADRILENNPDIVGFSCYYWNSSLSFEVAKVIKERRPEVKIMVGGPNLRYPVDMEYFKKYPYIDLICDVDGYGEIFITELFDQLTENQYDPENMTSAVYPTPERTRWKKSPKQFLKRTYVWPRGMYENGRGYIDRLIARYPDKPLWIYYEASRGCPFGCTYCEWGGGISSKTTFKPLEYVIEDFKFLTDNYDVISVEFTDANFGIVKNDIEIVKFLTNKRINGYKSLGYISFFGPTKVKKENLFTIYEELAKAELMEMIPKISVQSFNDDVKENIKRTDIPYDEQLANLLEIKRKYNLIDLVPRFELIMGLPGMTLDQFYEDFERIGVIMPTAYPWIMLPNTPAAAQEYRDKFKIDTIKVSSYRLDAEPLRSAGLIYDKRFHQTNEFVVGAYSYDRRDWVEMYLGYTVFSTLIITGLVAAPFKYIYEHHREKYADMIKDFMRSLLSGENNLHEFQKSLIYLVKEQTASRILENKSEDFQLIDLSSMFNRDILPDDPIIGECFVLAFMTDIPTFYKNLKIFLKARFDDPLVFEAVMWNERMVKTPMYDPDLGLKFSANRDWLRYVLGQGTLKDNKVVYNIKDTLLYKNGPKIYWKNGNMRIKSFIDFFKHWERYRLFSDVEVELVNLAGTPEVEKVNLTSGYETLMVVRT